jgi:cysteine desulfurase
MLFGGHWLTQAKQRPEDDQNGVADRSAIWQTYPMRESPPIYLDGFSTLPIAPEARAAMVAAWSTFGNPASPHAAGQAAAALVEKGRGEVAALIGAAPSQIVFTSGATEANNLAVLGVARALRARGDSRRRVIVSAIEHKAVLEPAQILEQEGFAFARAPVDLHGRLDLDALATLIDGETMLVSVMAVNNEVGVVQPVEEAAALAHQAGALFHTDAAQAAGKIPLDVIALDVDYLSLSAHKLYGPMGIGALYVAAKAPVPQALQFGGGQQGGIRPGTEPVALIAGFGAAAAIAKERLAQDREHGEALAARLARELAERQVRFVPITGANRLVPGGFVVALEDADARNLCLMLAQEVQLSTGSACTSGQLRMSHVLKAMGFSDGRARRVLRAFCHRYLNEDDISVAAARISAAMSAGDWTSLPGACTNAACGD